MVPAQHEIQRRDSTIPLAVWTRSNASEHKDSVNLNGLDMSNETIEFSTFSSPDDSPRTVRWDHDAATTCSGKRRTISARSHARVSAGAWPTASASCLSVTSRSVCPASRVRIESAGSSAARFRSTAARRRSVQSEPVLRRSFSSNCRLSGPIRDVTPVPASSVVRHRRHGVRWRRRREPAPTSP